MFIVIKAGEKNDISNTFEHNDNIEIKFIIRLRYGFKIHINSLNVF